MTISRSTNSGGGPDGGRGDSPDQSWVAQPDETVLVTGANGFIGVRVVNTLLKYGFRRVRCFVRPSGSVTRLRQVISDHESGDARVQIQEGNLLRREDCREAVNGVSLIFHLAAGI